MDVVTYFSNQLLFFVPLMNALKSPGFISTFQCFFVSAGMFFLSYTRPASLAFHKHPFASGRFSLLGEGGH